MSNNSLANITVKVDNLIDCLRYIDRDISLYEKFLNLKGLVNIPKYVNNSFDSNYFHEYIEVNFGSCKVYQSKLNLFLVEKGYDDVRLIVFNELDNSFEHYLKLKDYAIYQDKFLVLTKHNV